MVFVCLYPIIVKTALPIGPNFFVGPHVTQREVDGGSSIQIFASNKFVFANFEIQQIFLRNPQHFCLFLFYNVYIEKMFTIKIEYRCEEALKPSIVVRQFQKY